jgi:hypothetical protein
MAVASEGVKIHPRELTDDEVKAYWKNGWAKLDQLISSEDAAHMLARVKERMGETGDQHKARASDWSGVASDIWQSYHGLVFEDDVFRSFYFSETMGRNMQRLLRREVPIRHHLDIIACKMPKGSAAGGSNPSYWHQDFPSNGHDRAGSAVFWVALDDIPAERGSMRFRTGSHTLGELGNLREEWKASEDFHGGKRRTWKGDLFAEIYPFLDEDCPVSPPLDLKAGDATIHHSLVLHSAPENTTDQPRWAFISAYMPGDALYTGKPGNLAAEKAALTGDTLEIGRELTNEVVVYP